MRYKNFGESMKKKNKKLYDLMVNKSTQSFMLAIEL